MKRKLIKQIIEKHLKKHMRKSNELLKDCNIEPEFLNMDLSKLDYSIKENTFNEKKGMCFSVDGNIMEYFSYDGLMFKYAGQKLIDEIEKLGYSMEPWDTCHWDITEEIN